MKINKTKKSLNTWKDELNRITRIVFAIFVSGGAIHANAGLVYLGTFSGNNNNPNGLATLTQTFGLPAGYKPKELIIGEASSSGVSDNGFMITSTEYKEAQEAIAGEWWFDSGSSSFTTIDYLVVKAGKQYSLYEVDSNHGSWSTFGLGKYAMSHVTAYSVPTIHTPIPGSVLMFGSAIISLLYGQVRKTKVEK